MRTRWNLASILILGSILLVGLIFSARNAVTEKNWLNYSTRNLVGDTPEEVEQFALSYVSKHLIVSGTPQVLLIRPITQSELPALGLGCPQAKMTIEDPPQTLVILNGDFDVSRAGPGMVNIIPWHFAYVAYIFDNWSGNYSTFIYSRNGGPFRIALNDPTLPSDGPEGDSHGVSAVCPTQIPRPITRHFGEIVFEPTVKAPTAIAEKVPISGNTPIPTEIFPDPIPTSLSK
ncbi:MAG TPA: hypothetical protein VGE45_19880 [Chloroflexia bacterium]|jgi:hypothetical protein